MMKGVVMPTAWYVVNAALAAQIYVVEICTVCCIKVVIESIIWGHHHT